MFVHFLARAKKTEPKEGALPRLTLRVADPAGARGNSPALRRGQTVRALIPVRFADARRVAMGEKPYSD